MPQYNATIQCHNAMQLKNVTENQICNKYDWFDQPWRFCKPSASISWKITTLRYYYNWQSLRQNNLNFCISSRSKLRLYQTSRWERTKTLKMEAIILLFNQLQRIVFWHIPLIQQMGFNQLIQSVHKYNISFWYKMSYRTKKWNKLLEAKKIILDFRTNVSFNLPEWRVVCYNFLAEN